MWVKHDLQLRRDGVEDRRVHAPRSKHPSPLTYDEVLVLMKDGAVLRLYHRTRGSIIGRVTKAAGILNSLRLSDGTVLKLVAAVWRKLMEDPNVVETPSGTPHYTYYKIATAQPQPTGLNLA